jgi:phosphoglycolate phosphatase-like HAD superfamily hydrolase
LHTTLLRDWTCFADIRRGKMIEPLKAVLLDIDGTLLDSNDAHAAAWVDALAEFGFDVAFDRVRSLIGKGGDKVLPELTGLGEESPVGKEIGARRALLFKKSYFDAIAPFPRGRALLEAMKAAGCKLVVATSAKDEEVTPLLRLAKVDDLVDARTSSGDAHRSKPDPDIVQAALRQADCKPAQAILLGDTPYDVQSARRAGVASVAVRSGGWGDADLEGALVIYDDVEHILIDFANSPFASRTPRG